MHALFLIAYERFFIAYELLFVVFELLYLLHVAIVLWYLIASKYSLDYAIVYTLLVRSIHPGYDDVMIIM